MPMFYVDFHVLKLTMIRHNFQKLNNFQSRESRNNKISMNIKHIKH